MEKIEITQMTYTYRHRNACKLALCNLNVTVEPGEFVCIVGHSGCGKTTLLNVLAGLLKPSAGRVTIDGEPLNGPGTDRAIVFQNYSLFPWMTVRDNVRFGIEQARKDLKPQQVRTIAESVLERVGMEKAMDNYPFQLSGGMAQRVAIARALAMDAAILLLDEPFGALDAKRRKDLQMLLEKLWMESQPAKTILFVTHDIEEALILGDRILFMRSGRIAEIIPVPFERPRKRERLLDSPEFHVMKDRLNEMFEQDEQLETQEEDVE